MAEIDVRHIHHEGRHGVHVMAGDRGTERSGEEPFAYTRQVWARHVEVWVSATGRSVRVWVDGVEVPR